MAWGAISESSGSVRWKVPRLSGKRCPSRGDVGSRALVDSRGRWEHPAFRFEGLTTNKGYSISLTRRGTFISVVLRQQAVAGKVLRSGMIGLRDPALPFNGHRRKRWSDRGVARKQRRGRAVIFDVVLCRVLATWEGRLRRGCRSSQRSRSSFDRGRSLRRKKRSGSERETQRPRLDGLTSELSENRTLGSVSVRRMCSCRNR
jgi:hypothetical protein